MSTLNRDNCHKSYEVFSICATLISECFISFSAVKKLIVYIYVQICLYLLTAPHLHMLVFYSDKSIFLTVNIFNFISANSNH